MNRFKSLAIFIGIMALMMMLAGCVSDNGANKSEEGRINVVTSFFPLYDFATSIGGQHVYVSNLIPAGVEPHDWTPKSRDMADISKANLFIYQGAGFEGWVSDVLGGLDLGDNVVVEASRDIELIALSEDEDHGHAHAHDGDESVDPHTWLSPRSALTMAENILNGLKEADPRHATEYEANYEDLKAELTELDRKYTEELSGAGQKQIVVSHQAFGYLARDYGLEQIPILGVVPESEPTAQDLKRIMEIVRERNISYILTSELVSDKLAATLAADLDVKTLPLHSLEGVTEAELSAGETYISIMEKNLASLATALH